MVGACVHGRPEGARGAAHGAGLGGSREAEHGAHQQGGGGGSSPHASTLRSSRTIHQPHFAVCAGKRYPTPERLITTADTGARLSYVLGAPPGNSSLIRAP